MIKQVPKLTHKGAKAVLDAAERRAGAIGVPQCIAVVDDGGNLMAFTRMDGGKVSSIQVALTKAISAATRRTATGPVPDAEHPSLVLNTNLPIASGFKVTAIRGGLPLVSNGVVVGGIGVSSGTEDEDVDVATAGANVIH
jgi:glc operon protein GlcG